MRSKRLRIGEPLLGQPHRVEDQLAARDRLLHRRRVGHVAAHRLHAGGQHARRAPRVAHERAHLVAALGQRARHRVPDLAGGSRDQRPHGWASYDPDSERRLAAHGPLPDPQDPLFQALNSSISFDFRLAPFDLEQSLAHARMLARARDHLRRRTCDEIERGLERGARARSTTDSFVVAADDEDIHMAIERRLTELVGPVGGKLHTARSRNDQVATDVALLVRAHA